MHPQAPNTQTFLPACLLPTACDYNGLGCFDPLAVPNSVRAGAVVGILPLRHVGRRHIRHNALAPEEEEK
jgi:hypothetical protein